jgi:hypothetical protein
MSRRHQGGATGRKLEVEMKKSSKSRLVPLGSVSTVTRAIIFVGKPEFGSETYVWPAG